MNRNIYLMCILCTGLLPQLSFAQYFKAASTIPVRPTIYDSISLVDSFFTPYDGLKIVSQNFTRVAVDITITKCYIDSGSFTFAVRHDTIAIGYLPSGSYSCTFYSRKDARTDVNDPYVPCDSMPNLDTFYYSFVVSDFYNAISDLTLTSLTLSPNPATTTLYSSTALHKLDLSITDITGRIFPAPHTDRDIDISALPAGVYCLRLQTRDGSSIVRRFVRE